MNKKNIAALILGLVFAVILSEFGLRLFYVISDKGPYFSTQEKECVYGWLKLQEENLFTGINEYHPILGWTPKSNIANYTTTFQYVNARFAYGISTNSKGLRGTEEYSYERTNRTRIVVLGDSYSFGEQVNDKHTYPNQLEVYLKDVEVLNLAVSGYGTDQMYLKYQEEGYKYDPDIVLFAIFDADIGRAGTSCRNYFKPYYDIDDHSLTLQGVPVIPLQEARELGSELRWESYLKNLILHIAHSEQSLDEQELYGLEVTTQLLSQLQSQLHNESKQFLVVLLPRQVEIFRERQLSQPLLRQFMKANNISYVSLHEDFDKTRKKHRNTILWWTHFTPVANAITANTIATSLIEKYELTRSQEPFDVPTYDLNDVVY